MGLDNGIVIKKNEKTSAIEDKFGALFDERTYNDEYDVCYWRKCWNIRNEILYIINHRFEEEYEFSLDVEDVEQIIEFLGSLDADTWTDSGSSIWDWDEMEEHVQQDIENLNALVELMQEYDLDVKFYDSY